MLWRFRPTPALGGQYINILNDFENVVFESITESQDLKETTFFPQMFRLVRECYCACASRTVNGIYICQRGTLQFRQNGIQN